MERVTCLRCGRRYDPAFGNPASKMCNGCDLVTVLASGREGERIPLNAAEREEIAAIMTAYMRTSREHDRGTFAWIQEEDGRVRGFTFAEWIPTCEEERPRRFAFRIEDGLHFLQEVLAILETVADGDTAALVDAVAMMLHKYSVKESANA